MYIDWIIIGKIVNIGRRHVTIYRKPKDSTQKLFELIDELGKVAGYKINIQKSVAFPYTNNEILEKEYKNTF